MAIEVTDEAVEVLKRSMKLGNVDATSGGIRIRMAKALGGGSDVQVELADGAREGDGIVELEGLRLFVDASIAATIPNAIVAVEPQHENIVVRPA
jgi:Fe-S cluster assembly iron-binding protein IscA